MTREQQDCNSLSDREQDVFQRIMEYYTLDPSPIGSRKLSKEFDYSPATLRNIMADLEDRGLLQQPHVSAGRIPTDEGIRFYVNAMINKDNPGQPKPDIRRKLEETLLYKTEIEQVMQKASDVLSELTKYAGIVLAPKVISTIYRKIQFVRLGDCRVMVILVTGSGIIHHKIILSDQEYEQKTLDQISMILNERFESKTLVEIQSELIKLFEEDKRKYDKLLDSAARLSEMALKPELYTKEQVYIEGTINIFEHPEFKNLSKLRDLFKVLTERQAIIRLLDRCLSSDGIFIAIGDETENNDLHDVSIVTSKFSAGNDAVGGLGVIGPKRMPYQEIVALVSHTAKLLEYMIASSGHL